jgi:amino-acid N-acetyltransferase
MSSLRVRDARQDDLTRITALLQLADLPTLGVAEHLETFLVAEEDNGVIGSIGLEIYGDTALLRSAIVDEQKRRSGIGGLLYSKLLDRARSLKVHRLILLTNTAEEYFRRKGFRTINQNTVTGPITASVEFSGACPSHAACMELLL